MLPRKVPRHTRLLSPFLACYRLQQSTTIWPVRRPFAYGLPYRSSCTTRFQGDLRQLPQRCHGGNRALYSTITDKTFDKLLVANRGEIACRIMKTARDMGIKTVAVYSEQDANARHVQLADEAVCIGAADGYLSIPRILDAARQTGAQAVHPGYGFLSENPAFVRALQEAGITFVGPSPEAIAAMGDKIQSKLIAEASGVHCIPGYNGEVKSIAAAQEVAHAIGYPVMIKASAGGGGKGMRIAWNDTELTEGFVLAKQESQSAFGDNRMLIEKYIDNPRHIEVQVLGDNYGNVIYLPERECSIQRRNQKVIEESPSVHLDDETREKMGKQAVALAKHVGYNSAGTVEFLVDSQRRFYFLEMNTRLQVEHPVTEFVTGLDLVQQMIRSAAGYPLAIAQKDVQRRGWAIESRVYAEDPTKYLPSVGRLLAYQEPPCIPSQVRCDSGIMEGSEVAVEYDPLLCKLVTYGDTRSEAIDRHVNALDKYVIKGVTHNIPLLSSVLTHPRFRSGQTITTHFLAEEYPNGYESPVLPEQEFQTLAAVVASMWARKQVSQWSIVKDGIAIAPPSTPRCWDIWVRITDEQSEKMMETRINISRGPDDTFKAKTALFASLSLKTEWLLDDVLAYATVQEKDPIVVQYLNVLDLGFKVQYRGNKYNVSFLSDDQHHLSQYMKPKPKEIESQFVTSPMPGRIVRLAVQEGDKVVQGSEVAVMEAMKMQNVLRAIRDGTVKKVFVQQGNAVKTGQTLVEFEDEHNA